MRVVHAVLTEEDGIWVAQCLEFDVAAQGDTRQEAIENLGGAALLYVQELGHLPQWETVEVRIGA